METIANRTFLTAPEAAKFLGVSIQGLYGLTHRRAIPFYKPSGKNILFNAAELEAWILASRVEPVK